jgi:hypothetical protein
MILEMAALTTFRVTWLPYANGGSRGMTVDPFFAFQNPDQLLP